MGNQQCTRCVCSSLPGGSAIQVQAAQCFPYTFVHTLSPVLCMRSVLRLRMDQYSVATHHTEIQRVYKPVTQAIE